MTLWFGDIGDDGPMRLLMSRGYYFKRDAPFHWLKPTRFHTVSAEELACANFLVDEWDHTYDFRER